MKHIHTAAGFEADIDEGCILDMELFDSIVAVEKGNLMELPAVVDKVMGESKPALYDFVREENGRVPVEAVSNLIIEIIQGLAPKNS